MLNRRLLFYAVFALAVFAGGGLAQAQGQIGSNDPFNANRSSDPQKDTMLGSPEAEMRARLEIQRAEKLRKENLERAREVAQLGVELHDNYAKNRAFDHADIKKLERLEKLTRRIRSEAGGSDDDDILEDAPREMEGALTRIALLSVALRKGVEKTPRLVVSATVIDHANQLLELINFVRTLTPK